MKTITKVGDYEVCCSASPVNNMADMWLLEFTSYYRASKNPDAPHTMMATTVNYEGLRAIEHEIQSAIVDRQIKGDA